MPTTPVYALRYPAPADPADVPTDMNELATDVETALQGKARSLGYGTSLPASPVDGQEYVLVDSTTNPSYQWRFRYNASSSSSYKWEYLGGTTVFVATAIGSLETIGTLSTWQDLATVGPRFAVPRAGIYEAYTLAQMGGGSAASLGQIDLWNGTSGALNYAVGASSAGTGIYTTFGMQAQGVIGAGGDIRARYWANTAGTSFGNRTMRVTPVRVA